MSHLLVFLSIKTDNCEKLMKLVKEKVFVSDGDQAIQMLTLVPDDWTIPKTADYFEVTQYTVKQARRLKQEKVFYQLLKGTHELVSVMKLFS